MITAKEILDDMKNALKEFGTYDFDDKGPDEVMDMPAIINRIKSMPAADALAVLKQVDDSKLQEGRGRNVVESVIQSLDDDPLFEQIAALDDEFISDHY